MRAICGAVITAGALIGLGLTAVGIGQRYSSAAGTPPVHVKLSDVDGALLLILVVLVCTAFVGLAVAFVGLAYHHHRREREFLHARTHGVPASRN